MNAHQTRQDAPQATLDLSVEPVPAPAFDGPGHRPSDSTAKFTELAAVLEIMGSGKWYTDEQLAVCVAIRIGRHITTSTAGARRRDLRKAKHGGRKVDARPWRGTRTLEYRLA